MQSSLTRLAFIALAVQILGCAQAGNLAPQDAAPAPDLTVPRGGFNSPCLQPEDCTSGLCYKAKPADVEGRCTQPCTRDCPDNFECKTVRLDLQTDVDVCVPAEDTFCKRCTTHRECGDSSDLCLDIGGERFCALDCRGNPGLCPPGFACKQLGQVAEWTGVEQCMPVNNICCVDNDKDGRGKGDACIAGDCNDNSPLTYNDAIDICDGLDNDCKVPIDDNPINCKKAECRLGTFGYVQRAAEPCTAGACVMQSAGDCGLYTCSDGGEKGDRCATMCDVEDDKKCIPTAHCEASACFTDLNNGEGCNEQSDCKSDHCQNAFCCDVGDCCKVASDCPNVGANAPACDDAATCQGTRGVITCTTNRCAPVNGVPDDTACIAAIEANKCGYYKSIFCNGQASQTPPSCPTSCSTHNDCDPEGFCEPVGKTCKEDLENGQACGTDNARCKSGHCQNGYCCATGDCCAVESNCPVSYTTTPVCATPTACQGKQNVARCLNYTCSTETNVDNDSACAPATLANDCGPYKPLYCDGQPAQTPPVCPTTCSSNGDCDLNAYCNAGNVCVPDEGNGRPCRNGEECTSTHCQNGYCCATGDCCATAANCGGYAQAPVCNSQSACQGTRIDAACSAAFQCGTAIVDDDSACVGLLSNDCGPYPSVSCTSMVTQPTDQAGRCVMMCTDDNGCDVSAHCAAMVCVPDVGKGGFCNLPSDCQAGFYCVDRVCCTSQCTGSCEACNVAGAFGDCTAIPAGTDPDSECPGVGCSAYYHGWLGDTCYRKADVSAAQASCSGSRSCRTVAQECTAQTVRGSSQITCNSFCQDPNLASCTGTVAGTCTNVSQGSATCGSGVCQVTAPRCVSGQPNACVPASGNASTETCNNIDDNCDGTIDNGSFADGYESNYDCNTYRTLPAVGSDQTLSQSVTLYPSGDVDYFRINANETDSSCACCDFFCTDEDYEVVVTLDVPVGAGSYQFCINRDICGDVGNNCQPVFAGTSASWTYGPRNLDGGCPGGDSFTFFVRISAGNSPGYECLPYKLTYSLDAGRCG